MCGMVNAPIKGIMDMQLIIFDDQFRSNFFPLTLNRSTSSLRCGILKLRQRLESLFAGLDDFIVQIDPLLVPLYHERHEEWLINTTPRSEKLYVNSRLKLEEEAIKLISNLSSESGLLCCGKLVAAKTTTQLDINNPKGIKLSESSIQLYTCLSDLIHDNSRMIEWDFQHFFYEKDNFFETEPGVTVLHPYNVWIAEEVTLSPGVVLDASTGPIVLDRGARVMANAVLCGPLYLGKNCVVKIGAKLYGGSSFGAVCKVGGEIEGSIFQAYSNKQHDGFLGHSYIGEWVNIGADTNNSDLKNTYKNVSYYSYTTQSKQDSGTQFLGCVIGDHSKTGINCSINTGAVIGLGCNLWGRALINDFMPDFSWGEADSLSPYRLEAFYQTAAIVKQRRNLSLTPIEQQLYLHINKLGD